jgi:hypothetical protein
MFESEAMRPASRLVGAQVMMVSELEAEVGVELQNGVLVLVNSLVFEFSEHSHVIARANALACDSVCGRR